MIIYNCPKDALEKCSKLTPGRRAPTVTPLSEEGWFSVSSLVDKGGSNRIMDELVKSGARDILCMALANTRM